MYVHKRGANLDMTGQISTSVTGEPVPDFTGFSGSAAIRSLDDTLIDTLVFEWLDVGQRLVRIYSEDTTGYTIGIAELDIKLTDSAGTTIFSTTQQIQIVKEITRA